MKLERTGEEKNPYDIVLIDGSHMAYRAYHSLAEFTTGGMKSGMGYGVLKMLDRVKKIYTPERIIFCWEGHHNWRRLKYKWYKADRDTPDKEYIYQVHDLKIMLSRMGVSQYFADRYEADDVLAFFARGHASKGRKVLIVTGDHDLRQEVTENIIVMAPTIKKYDVLFDIAMVKEKYEVGPELLLDLWALMGDKGDGVDGVRGVGVKIATRIVKNNGTVEDIEDMGKGGMPLKGVPPRISKQVYSNISKVRMNKSLIRLAEGMTKEDIESYKTDSDTTLEELFRKYKYVSFLKEIDKWVQTEW